jgi:hypothetical protein
VVDKRVRDTHTSSFCSGAFGAGATSKGGQTYERSHVRSFVASSRRRHARRLLTQFAR